jgi:drug/metabolite transporter (DMT)-like permease
MLGILLAISVAIIWSIGEVNYSNVSKKYDHKNIYLYTFLLRAIIYMSVVIIFSRSLIGTFNYLVFITTLPIIMCDLFASLTINVAVTNGKLAVVSPIMASYPALDILLGMLLLKEKVTPLEISLSLLITIAIIILAKNQKETQKVPHPEKGIIFSILYMLLAGLSIYFEKSIYISDFTVYDLYYYKGMIYICTSLFFAFKIFRTSTKMKKPTIDIIKGCGLTPIGNVIDSFALNFGSMTIVTPISSLYAVITNFISRYYLKEKVTILEKICIATIIISTLTLIILTI